MGVMAISRKRKFIIGISIGLLLVVVLAISLTAGNREAPEVTVAEVKQVPLPARFGPSSSII
jgi:hypothetical protein